MYDLHLPIEPGCPTLDQRYIRSQAHLVDMAPSIKVVQRIEDKIEPFEPADVELRIFYVGMMRFELDMGVKFCSGFFRNLAKKV